MTRLLRERRGTTTSGLRLQWAHVGRTEETREYMQWSIMCGAWEWESEEDYALMWTWDRVSGLAAGLDYITNLGPDGAAALAATIRRNMVTTAAAPNDNVIQLRPR